MQVAGQGVLALEGEGALIDHLRRVGRRGQMGSAAQWREIRGLRDQIAIPTDPGARPLGAVRRATPLLLAAAERGRPPSQGQTRDLGST